MRHHKEIRFHLMIRVDRLIERLERQPSFLAVGLQEVRDFAQWQLDNKLTNPGQIDYQEIVLASFNGILPEFTVWNVCGVNLRQV